MSGFFNALVFLAACCIFAVIAVSTFFGDQFCRGRRR